jgi:hypothetical protein
MWAPPDRTRTGPSRSPFRPLVTRVHALPKPALDLLFDPTDGAAAEMDPLWEQTRTLQPIDVGEAVTDLWVSSWRRMIRMAPERLQMRHLATSGDV